MIPLVQFEGRTPNIERLLVVPTQVAAIVEDGTGHVAILLTGVEAPLNVKGTLLEVVEALDGKIVTKSNKMADKEQGSNSPSIPGTPGR